MWQYCLCLCTKICLLYGNHHFLFFLQTNYCLQCNIAALFLYATCIHFDLFWAEMFRRYFMLSHLQCFASHTSAFINISFVCYSVEWYRNYVSLCHNRGKHYTLLSVLFLFLILCLFILCEVLTTQNVKWRKLWFWLSSTTVTGIVLSHALTWGISGSEYRKISSWILATCM